MDKLDACFEALRSSDSRTISQRVDRMLAMSLYVEDGSFYGVDEPLVLMEDARVSYINGCFVAALISAMSSIEHMLLYEINARGIAYFKPEKRDSISNTLKLLGLKTVGDEELIEELVGLNNIRNAYVHPKEESNLFRRVNRAKAAGVTPNDISKQDAESAIKVMYKVFDLTTKLGYLSEFE